jgi:hypothetical protein
MPDRPQKITFAEMRKMGVRGLLIYCADFSLPAKAATLAATLLGFRQRLGLGFGLGIADGLSQHFA